MQRTVNIDKEYRCSAEKAIEKFFKAHPELDYWREQFEWMNEANVNHDINDTAETARKWSGHTPCGLTKTKSTLILR